MPKHRHTRPPKAPTVVPSAQRPGLRLIKRVARNPLDALPPEVFDHLLVDGWGPIGRALHVVDPALIHDVLVARSDLFAKTKVNRRVLEPTLGEGLLVAEGPSWRWQRRAAAPVFQPAQLATLTPAILAGARETRDRWLAEDADKPLRLNHEMMRTTFLVIVNTMLGGSQNVDALRFGRDMAETLEPMGWALATAMLGLPRWVPYPGQRRAVRASAHLRETTARLIAEHRCRGSGTADLLDLLSVAVDPDSGRKLGDVELLDNLLTFIAAGHETTALGLAWTLHLLAAHPDVEAKAQAEIDDVVGEAEVEPDHLSKLTFNRQVFSEAMRLYPPAPLISRAPVRACELGGASLKAGAQVAIPIYALHRNRRLWDDPERFDPERFSPSAVMARHRFAFLPFGGGPHVCIGSGFAMQEAVAILAVLLQRLRIRPSAGMLPPKPVMQLTLKPMPEPVMLVERRVVARRQAAAASAADAGSDA